MKFEIIESILAGIVEKNAEILYNEVNVYVSPLHRPIKPQRVCYDDGRFVIQYSDKNNTPATSYLYVNDIKDIIFRDKEGVIKFVFDDEVANEHESFIEFIFGSML